MSLKLSNHCTVEEDDDDMSGTCMRVISFMDVASLQYAYPSLLSHSIKTAE